MTGKIVEVLAKILEGLNQNFSLEEVNSQLTKNKDFDRQTVSVAFSLVYDKVLSNRIPNKKDKSKEIENFRFFTDSEKEIIGLENYNYILHLVNVGLLNSADLEMVLEQVMMFPEDTVTKDDINWIILISLVDFNVDILPGSRVLLYSSDTIN